MTKKRFKGLSPNAHYRHARDFVDIDYDDQLSDEDAEWMANFLDSYYCGRFKVDDDKNPVKDRKDCYRRAHRQRRDFMSGRSASRVVLDGEGLSRLDTLDVAAFKDWCRSLGESDEQD